MQFPERILIVEDETITQRYLKDILTHYHVKHIGCYDNAEDALNEMKANAYDMILMDINIKGSVDGIQLAQKILQHYSVPIVFITAHSDQDTFQEVLELSPYGFISKPFSARDVEMTLQVAYKRYLAQLKTDVSHDMKNETEMITINQDYRYSESMKILYRNDEAVKLNSKHRKLIDILCRNINHTVEYATLTVEIWENNEIADSALRTLVYSLRKQLPDFPLVSYSKVGYSIKKE